MKHWKCEITKTKLLAVAVAVIVIAIIATGLVILLGNQPGNPTTNPSTGTAINIDQATSAVQSYLGRMGYSNLSLKTMQEYSNMYYAQVVESNNGTGAFELSVDSTTGVVTPMQGATMLWNTKYGVNSTGMMGYMYTTSSSGGMMGGDGMMNWLRGTPTTHMTISIEQAQNLAQQYLDVNQTGTTIGQLTTYYGYYTMQVMNDGHVVGMMSIYGNTGQVMYYSQMGTYMQQKLFG
jgi:hypothetical protein